MYESHFGLIGKPFQLNPDPDFFFGSRGHKRALAYLEYGLHRGEGFIVVTGDVGAGKTTLLRGLLRRLPTESIVAAHIVSTQLEADDLIRLVSDAFGLSADGTDKAGVLVRLQAHLTTLHASGRRALLVVDEAQNLSARAVEELRMLSNFQVGTHSLVQSFLVGQPEFRTMMQRPEMQQLKQRIIASYHLGPLDAGETARYVEHRLAHVGWTGRPAFGRGAHACIHRHTGGVPRRINALCDRLLLGAYLGDRTTIEQGDVDQTAVEIEEELGLGPLGAGPAPIAAVPNATVGATDERTEDLERRIATLETSYSLLHGLMKRIVQTLRERAAAPASPAATVPAPAATAAAAAPKGVDQ